MSFETAGESAHGVPKESAHKVLSKVSPVLWQTDMSSVGPPTHRVAELNPDDFSVIRTQLIADDNVRGIGGDTDNIYTCSFLGGPAARYLKRLSPVDFSTISQTSSIGPGETTGAGGEGTTIWVTCYVTPGLGNIQEVFWNGLGFTQIRSVTGPDTCLGDIGGDETTIWQTTSTFNTIRELSTADLSIIRTGTLASIFGIGGSADIIYASTTGASGVIYELSTIDFSVVRSLMNSRNNRGIGGK